MGSTVPWHVYCTLHQMQLEQVSRVCFLPMSKGGYCNNACDSPVFVQIEKENKKGIAENLEKIGKDMEDIRRENKELTAKAKAK